MVSPATRRRRTEKSGVASGLESITSTRPFAGPLFAIDCKVSDGRGWGYLSRVLDKQGEKGVFGPKIRKKACPKGCPMDTRKCQESPSLAVTGDFLRWVSRRGDDHHPATGAFEKPQTFRR